MNTAGVITIQIFYSKFPNKGLMTNFSRLAEQINKHNTTADCVLQGNRKHLICFRTTGRPIFFSVSNFGSLQLTQKRLRHVFIHFS